MTHDVDIAIVGGGLAGLSLAVALRASRLSVAVVEGRVPSAPAPDSWDARVYAVSPGNARFLDGVGIWRHLDAARLTPVRAMEIFGDAQGNGRLDFSEIGRAHV